MILTIAFLPAETLVDPPAVEIISPMDNSDYFHGDNILIQVIASDDDGTVEEVVFFADGEPIGSDITAPFDYLWQQPPIGNWDLVALARDNDGNTTESEKVDISINFPEYDHEVHFSENDPFPTTGFELTLSTALQAAEIWYTLDGSDPLSSDHTLIGIAPTTVQIDPMSNLGGRGTTPGVHVTAVVMFGGEVQSWVKTKTYIFIDQVSQQGFPGGSWPIDNVNGQVIDYFVSQDVVNDPAYQDLIDDALLDIPSISLVTDLDHLFDPQTGIYVNAAFHGREWERPVSIELLNPDGSQGFQINGGFRIRGGWSRHDNFPKHAFRLFFREDYGDRDLDYPLFENEGVDDFRKLDLRTSQNYAWSNGYIWENTMNRDVFSRDLQRDLGRPYTRSRYYHLYLNGMYWGLFQSQERPEANFAESYLGGNDDDWDVVKVDIGEDWNLYEIEATDGNLDAWFEVWEACESGFESLSSYFALEGRSSNGDMNPQGRKLVDIDNLIDYMMIIFYTGNIDAPMSKFRGEASPNNFYALRDRTENEGFIFLTHDSEHTLLVDPHWPSLGLMEDRVNAVPQVNRFEVFHPQWLHHKLTANPEYRIRFADRVYELFNNRGILMPERLAEVFQTSADEIDLAIIGESMRWGDLERSKHAAWEPAIETILDNYFPQREEIFMDQLRQGDLYPDIIPPDFVLEGSAIEQPLIQISETSSLTLENSAQTGVVIFYTLDGSDPRNPTGIISPTALGGGPSHIVELTGTMVINARNYSADEWSALHKLQVHHAGDLTPLQLTEIHYHPLDEGSVSGREYEFLEFTNTSENDLDLSLLSFGNGLTYEFPSSTHLQGGEYLVLASNSSAFTQRYGTSAFAEFEGQLDNGGERLVLLTVSGDTVINVRYDDQSPWPEEPDGDGPSLVWTGVAGSQDLNDPANWSASQMIHGTPGAADPVGIESGDPSLPLQASLSQNYPNPFNPSTTIRYGLSENSQARLTIHDLRGQLVFESDQGLKEAGWYEIIWKAQGSSGEQLPSGVYVLTLTTGTKSFSNKMLHLK